MNTPPITTDTPSSPVKLVPYGEEWLLQCLELITQLTPEHFMEADREEFESFLAHLPGPYTVLLDGDSVVGCGGVALEPGGLTATLCWGMVAPTQQGKGLGSLLTAHRIAQARSLGPRVRWLQVNTSQKVDGFYAKHGFEEVDRHVGAFGPDLDHVHMRRGISEGS